MQYIILIQLLKLLKYNLIINFFGLNFIFLLDKLAVGTIECNKTLNLDKGFWKKFPSLNYREFRKYFPAKLFPNRNPA